MRRLAALVMVAAREQGSLTCPQVEEELAALGLTPEASAGIVAATGISCLGDLEALLGAGDAAVAELAQLFALAEGYGFADWLQLDTSCVRGLAYYTGARAHAAGVITASWPEPEAQPPWTLCGAKLCPCDGSALQYGQ